MNISHRGVAFVSGFSYRELNIPIAAMQILSDLRSIFKRVVELSVLDGIVTVRCDFAHSIPSSVDVGVQKFGFARQDASCDLRVRSYWNLPSGRMKLVNAS